PITSLPNPNIALTGIAVADSGVSGQPLHLDIGVENQGPGNIASRTWSVSAFLSVDSRLDRDDIPLGSVPGPPTLAAHGTATLPLDVTLPSFASGAYFLIVQADSRNEIVETNESDNLTLRPLLAILPPPADLVVQDVTFQGAVTTPGRPVSVTYTL